MSIIYVLTNPAMPGLVKIGKTTRDNPQVRMNELNTTGVPQSFRCDVAVEVEDEKADELEKALHKAFAPYRKNTSREFFEIEPYQVKAILRTWSDKDVTPTTQQDDRRVAIQGDNRTRRPNLNFTEMKIPIGSKLTSTIREEEATVISSRKVLFRGEEMFLTEATEKVRTERGRNNPTPHWRFNGRLLQDIYDETYGARIVK